MSVFLLTFFINFIFYLEKCSKLITEFLSSPNLEISYCGYQGTRLRPQSMFTSNLIILRNFFVSGTFYAQLC